MYPFVFLTLVLLLSLPAGSAAGQASPEADVRRHPTLSGRATDASTGTPLTGAHAFIGSTMVGAVTDLDGKFHLKKIPAGTHTLWISMIGYEPASQTFAVSDTTTHLTYDIALEPAIIEVGELTVTAKRDRRWKKRLDQFVNMFIGQTPYARETRIVNTEVLDFDANWLGRFEAFASAPLIIENHALGYRVEYVLKEFEREGSTIRYDGDPLFVELDSESQEQTDLWHENRRTAFYGSLRHFFLSLLDGKTEEEGFIIMRLPSIEDIARNDRKFSIRPGNLLDIRDDEILLSFHGILEITYTKAREDEEYLRWKGAPPTRSPSNQRSWIRLSHGPTAIDPNGEIIDPYGITVYGYYAYLRMANDLPKEYRPPPEPLTNDQ